MWVLMIFLTVALVAIIMKLPYFSLNEKKYLAIFTLLFIYGGALFIPSSIGQTFEASIECDNGICIASTKPIGEPIIGDSIYDKVKNKVVGFFTYS